MGSIISWLDHSEDDQRRIREVLELFSDKETVDDLGLGTIRDTFSNLMFPGTSVTQTRARYFLFIPWTFRYFERKTPDRVVAKASDFQRGFIEALKEGGDHSGIIGINAGKNVKLLPSTIYWNGMARNGIFTAPGLSQVNYGRRVARGSVGSVTEDELVERVPSFWNREIPDPPADFHKLVPTNFELSRDEAEWLCERVTSTDDPTNGASLMSTMLREFRRGAKAPTEDQLWDFELPVDAPSRMVELVRHAEQFSCAANGAALLYNLMLAELRDPTGDGTDFVDPEFNRERLDGWVEWAEAIDLQSWCLDAGAMWTPLTASQARIPVRTRGFVEDWAAAIGSIGPAGVADAGVARDLIRERELTHKRGQARFANSKRIQTWEGLAGTSPMAYRWPQVRRILTDIATGLGNVVA